MNPEEVFQIARAIVRCRLPLHTLANHMLARLSAVSHDCHAPRGGCAQLRYVLACKHSLLALLHWSDQELWNHRLDILQPASQALVKMLRRTQYLHRERVGRRPYQDEACGEPPFRDQAHEALRVLNVAPRSNESHSGCRYGYELVEPFVCAGRSKRKRASLYRSRLEPRRLREEDLWRPDERALIGQWGVFAKAAIPAGTCVGVMGGQLMDRLDTVLVTDNSFLMQAYHSSDASDGAWVNGENLMSLCNTLMLLDGAGKFVGHPDDGYTMELGSFPAELSHGWTTAIQAFFTTRDIRPGEELRWYYGLTKFKHALSGCTSAPLAA